MSEDKRLQKWADIAMYEAVPTNTTSEPVEPTVKLISMTPDPLGVIAAASRMYEGKPVEEAYYEGMGGLDASRLEEISDDERRRYFEQIKKTRLQAPFEFVTVHFLIEGVTRAFTHQLVRQRTAVYVQESQRFAVKINGEHEVALPPSLAGPDQPQHEHHEDAWDNGETGVGAPVRSWHNAYERLAEAEKMRVLWDECVENIAESYNLLVNMGMPAEDARGLLPTNITTRIHYKTDLRNLLSTMGNRLCTQAQFEWRKVAIGMVKAVRESGVYMADELADLFRPICYATGKCEFMADMDRYCSIRERVELNHRSNRPSSEWGRTLSTAQMGEFIPAIRPEEWLADPAAARRSV